MSTTIVTGKKTATTPITTEERSTRTRPESRRTTTSTKPNRKLSWDKQRTAELFQRCRQSNDVEARDELITMYLNLVHFLANKFRNRGEPIEDLIQVGTIGLIKAVDRFDTGRGLEFTTYATPTILGEMKRHFRDKCWALKVPRRLQELSSAVTKAMDELTRELQRSPTMQEIATRLDVNVEDVLDAMESSSAYNVGPLDAGANSLEGETFNLLDVLGDVDPMMGVAEDRATLAAALKDISPEVQRVVYLRFFEGLTQTEIAREIGVSQMQVSRMLRKALPALRASLISN